MQRIKPLGEIAVAFAANSEFIPYTAVMIQSIIDRADEERLYDLVVLYSDIECELIERVISLAAGHHNDKFDFDESVIPRTAEFLFALALRYCS